MLDVLWTPLIVFSLWAYIGLNVFRYKYFEYKSNVKSLILFVIFRIIVISALITYLFLSFNDYVFYCQMKLFWYFVSLIFILILEFIYSLFSESGDDFGDLLFAYIFATLIYSFVTALSLAVTLAVLDKLPVNKIEVDSNVTQYNIVQYKDTSIESEEQYFGIEGYRDDGDYYYSLYYVSNDDGNEIEHLEINEKDLDGKVVILEEGKTPYVEKHVMKYKNREELDQTEIHVDDDKHAKYKIYAPLSQFHGEFDK